MTITNNQYSESSYTHMRVLANFNKYSLQVSVHSCRFKSCCDKASIYFICYC